MSGTEIAYAASRCLRRCALLHTRSRSRDAIGLRARYAMPGTDTAYLVTLCSSLCACYAVSGTDAAYRPTLTLCRLRDAYQAWGTRAVKRGGLTEQQLRYHPTSLLRGVRY
eukprot:1028530-Rhodomonas_salina.2